MKYLYCLLSLCLSFCVLQFAALADSNVVKIYPKSGEPMIVRKLSVFEWHSTVQAVWNQQRIEVPISKIKSVKFLGTHPDEQFELEVELTMKNGEKPVMRIENQSCHGETRFGKLSMYLDEMVLLDLDPDLRPPQGVAPVPAPEQGANQ